MTIIKDKQVLDLTKGNTPYDLMVSTVEVIQAPEQVPLQPEISIMSEIAARDSERAWTEAGNIPEPFDEFPTEINHSGVSGFVPFEQLQQELQSPIAVTAYGIRPPTAEKMTLVQSSVRVVIPTDIDKLEKVLKIIDARIEAYSSLFPHPETDTWLRALEWVKKLLAE